MNNILKTVSEKCAEVISCTIVEDANAAKVLEYASPSCEDDREKMYNHLGNMKNSREVRLESIKTLIRLLDIKQDQLFPPLISVNSDSFYNANTCSDCKQPYDSCVCNGEWT